LLVAVPFGPLLSWKRGDLLGAAQRLLVALAAAAIGIATVFVINGGGPVLAPFAIGLALYVMIGALVDLAERTQAFRQPWSVALRRAAGLPRSAFGTTCAHFGIGILLLGVICESFYGAERIATMKPQETISIRGYDLSFDGLASRQGSNYRELIAKYTVRRDGTTIDTLEPSKRTFTTRTSSTTEAALMTRGFSQLYVSLGDPEPDGSISVRIYHKPLVLLIWFGALVMAFGGLLSLSDRRLRVGAPKPARKSVLQPAE
jgi:cytochrome c-type biogenesis protein CcmF